MMNPAQPALNTQLKQLAQAIKAQRLEALFTDPKRVEQHSLQVGQIYLDYSKNFVTPEIMQALMEWAYAAQLPQAIQQLLSGENVNITEKRPALHSALRCVAGDKRMVKGEDVVATILAQKAKMATLVEKLQQGKWLGATGKPITDVVNIGIGGSDLGPLMTVEALAHCRQSALNIHFVSNIDPAAIAGVVDTLNSETTLFIISSKSFGTPETLTNAQVAREWLAQSLGRQDLAQHFIAVTANPAKAQQFGILPEHMLSFCEWVGGRYSIWSTIGLPLALNIGMENFEQFLAGGRCMDEHFAHAPLAKNMPVILGLLGAWYVNFFDAPTIAILPYAQGLRRFPDYLQQLDMESNGKTVRRQGENASYATGPIVWGQAGTNGQHAFYQLLHQGTHFIPVDFIVAAKTHTQYPQLHKQLVANCFAQAQALMQGAQNTPTPHEHMEGNKASNLLLLDQLTPFAIGQLVALYEHKVYVQGILWDINSYDQPGVELGKKLANELISSMDGREVNNRLDASTRSLLSKI